MLEQQQTDHFIGRSAEIDIFRRWLADPVAPGILYIHDAAEEADKKGGVGKTWLMQEYAKIVRQEQPDITIVAVDFFNIGDRDRVFLAEKIVAGLEQLYPEWTAAAFVHFLQEFRTGQQYTRSGRSGDSSETKGREGLIAALTEDLRRLDSHLAAQQKQLLIFFDTFEAIEPDPRIVVLRLSANFPDTYGFANIRSVVAGRNKLDWSHLNWQGREQEVLVIPLAPFNQGEMLEYVRREAVVDITPLSKRATALHDRTEGRPIIIGLAIDVLNNRIQSLDQLLSTPRDTFESYLVPQVNKLENPINWVILFMAHVYHHFNLSILEWLLANVTVSEPMASIDRAYLEKALPELSFIRRPGSGEDFVLHDEMRRLVTKYCWEVLDTDRRYRKDISRGMIRYYEQEMTRSLDEQQRLRYTVELLYHRLFVDLDEGMNYFQEQFLQALHLYKRTNARLVLQEAQKFASDFSPTQYSELLFADLTLLREDENPLDALVVLERLKREGDPQWLADKVYDYLLEEGRCYALLSRFREAIEVYEQCLKIQQARGDEDEQALVLRNLGAILQRRGQFDDALDYYQQSIALFKKLGRQADYATLLTNISNVYRLQGKTQEALRTCKFAWNLRTQLLRQGKISEVQVGLSFQSLGVIYLNAGDIVEAEHCFRETLNIYQRTNYKAGLATVHNRFGQVQMQKGDLEGARIWFVKAQEEAREIIIDQYINSLNKQGRIYALQQQWNDAESHFAQAIAVSRQIPDFYQQVENLIDLAGVLVQMGKNEQVESNLQEAEAIAQEENYLNLLGRIEQVRGESDYAVNAYAAAFQHFVAYCHYMAQYNIYEYTLALQKVVDALLGIPRSETPAIVQELIASWKAKNLDEDYPDFVQAFENLEQLMDI